MPIQDSIFDLKPSNPLVVSAGTASLLVAAYAARRRWGKIATADYITVRLVT